MQSEILNTTGALFDDKKKHVKVMSYLHYSIGNHVLNIISHSFFWLFILSYKISDKKEYSISMLEYDKSGVSEGTDVINKFIKRMLYLLLLIHKRFRFEVNVCNGCHNLMQKAASFNDVVTFFY